MRQGIVKYNNIPAGKITEEDHGDYLFEYDEAFVHAYPNLFITFSMLTMISTGANLLSSLMGSCM